MTFPLGWDSSEFVRAAHRDLEFLSIVGFVVCAICEWIKHLNPDHGKLIERLVVGSFIVAALLELIAFPYGERNDELAREQANKQDFAISTLSKQAQEALIKTKKALDDSNTAISKAGDALSKSDDAEGAASQAITLARDARTEADSFETKITSAEEKAFRLEQQLAWRTVTKEQIDTLRTALSPSGVGPHLLAKDIRVRIAFLAGDAEGGEYADELVAALNSLGVDALGPLGETLLSSSPRGTPQGLTLQVKSATMPEAILLQRALKQAGIDAPGQLLDTDVVTLLVGVKPHPVRPIQQVR